MPIYNTSFSVSFQSKPTATVQWYIGGGAVGTRTALTNDGTYANVTTRVLNIYDVGDYMNGDQFSCKLTNSIGSTWSQLATLNVEFKPTITTQPITQEVGVLTTMTLVLGYTVGNPASTTFVWKKDNVTISNGGRVSGATSATLVITSMEEADEGSYTCVISNSVGSVTSDAAVITTVILSYPYDCPIGSNFWYDTPTGPTVNAAWTTIESDANGTIIYNGGRYEHSSVNNNNLDECNMSQILAATPVRFNAYLGVDTISYSATDGSDGSGNRQAAAISFNNGELIFKLYIKSQRLSPPYKTIKIGLEVERTASVVFGLELYSHQLTALEMPLTVNYSGMVEIVKVGSNVVFYWNGQKVYTTTGGVISLNTNVKVTLLKSYFNGAMNTYTGWIKNIRAVGAGYPLTCTGVNPYSGSYWLYNQGFTFDPGGQGPLTQTSASQAFINYAIADVSGFSAYMQATVKIGNYANFGISQWQGMGIRPNNPGYSDNVGPIGLNCLGAWFDNVAYVPDRCYIFSSGYSPIYTSTDLPSATDFSVEYWISVSAPTSPGYYNVTVRIKLAAYGIDHTEIVNYNIPSGFGMFSIGGCFGTPGANQKMIVNAITITD